MSTLSCAFFGHRDYSYWAYKDRLEEAIRYLIGIGVTEFYSGNRGDFDILCAHMVSDLQVEYPDIKNILVLSYLPDVKFKLPEWYNEAVYLLDKRVPPRYAIYHTNRKLAQTANFIIVGVDHKWGGAWSVYQYAKKNLYSTLNIITGEADFFFEEVSREEIDRIGDEYKEEIAQLYLRIKDEVEATIVKNTQKKGNRKQEKDECPVWVSVTKKKETTDY